MKVVHLKEKDYQCSKCSYATGHVTDFKQHLKRVHGGLSGIACELCGYSYASKAGLAMHMSFAHPKEWGLRRLVSSKLVVEELQEDSMKRHLVVQKIPVVLLQRIRIKAL